MATAVTVMDTVMVTDMVMATTVMDMVMVATDMGMVMEIGMGMGMGMGMGGMAVTAVGGRAAIGTTASAHAGC
jgi:hypothetical protein